MLTMPSLFHWIRNRAFGWGVLLCLAVASAAATEQQAPLLPYSRGVLWRVETTGAAPSYLFGTLHSDDPRVTRLPPPVKQAFERARSFTMEMLTDDAALATIAKHISFDDGQTLPALLGDNLYAETRAALAAVGLPDTGLERQKPWVIVMLLSTPRPRHGLSLDLALQAQAVAQSKAIHGLETAAEQLSVLNDLPLADQVVLLKDTLRSLQHRDAQIEELTRAYLARDLAGIMKISDRNRPADARVHDALMERLLTQRNVRMAQRMQARLKEGDAFVAVGAAHLPGRHGLLHLLARGGYRVSAVY